MGQCGLAKVTVVGMEARINCTALCVKEEPGLLLRGHVSGVDRKLRTLRPEEAQT